MILEPQWIYWVITVPFLAVWCALYVYAKEWRRAQIRISALFAVVGVVVENIFYFKDYWHPPAVFQVTLGPVFIYPEFLLFGAAFAGIAAVAYPALFHLLSQKTNADGKLRRAITCGVVFVGVSWMLWSVGLNSIYATAFGAMILTIFVSLQRRDLFLPAVMSASITSSVMFAVYSIGFVLVLNVEDILAVIWYLHDTPLDIRVWHVPLTELVWGFSVSSAIPTFYMYVRGARYVRV